MGLNKSNVKGGGGAKGGKVRKLLKLQSEVGLCDRVRCLGMKTPSSHWHSQNNCRRRNISITMVESGMSQNKTEE